jgi:hypothetical protein
MKKGPLALMAAAAGGVAVGGVAVGAVPSAGSPSTRRISRNYASLGWRWASFSPLSRLLLQRKANKGPSKTP